MTKEKDIPVLKGFLTVDGRRIRVWCPFCKNYHTHGVSEGISQGKKSHRIEHCFEEESKKHFLCGYFIQPEKRKIFR